MRPLGIRTVADRIAQEVVRRYLEPLRPGRSAIARHADRHSGAGGRIKGASNNGLRSPARYGQNDRALAIGRKSYLFARFAMPAAAAPPRFAR
jgi:hypothetical protein